MKDYLTFRKMVTPVLIAAVFWIITLVIVLKSTGMIFGGNFLIGLAVLVLGIIAARVMCELLILMFRMQATQEEILKALGGTAVSAAADKTVAADSQDAEIKACYL